MADRVVQQQPVPRVMVILTSGGVMDSTHEGDVDLELVDFQNLEAGDVVPEFTPEMVDMLARRNPALLKDLEEYRARFECQNCGKEFWDENALRQIKDIHQRVAPGEPMPAGECPDCHALVSVVKLPSWADIQSEGIAEDTSREFIGPANTERIASIMMQDVVGDYDLPDNVAEWQWVEAHASFRHRQNGEPGGVWDFMLNLSYEFTDVPEKLAPLIAEAKLKGISYLLFHQGT